MKDIFGKDLNVGDIMLVSNSYQRIDENYTGQDSRMVVRYVKSKTNARYDVITLLTNTYQIYNENVHENDIDGKFMILDINTLPRDSELYSKIIELKEVLSKKM